MKKIANAAVLLCLGAALLAVPALTLTKSRYNTASYYENRNLAARPEFSTETFWSGAYFDDWETWYADHAPGRTTVLHLNTKLQMNVLQRPVVNDIVVTDELLLPKLSFSEKSKESFEKAAEPIAKRFGNLNDYVESVGGRMLFVGLPEQRIYFQDRFPDYFNDHAREMADADTAFMEAMTAHGVDFLDMAAVYDAKGHPVDFYSVVDHHFNGYGAYEAYRSILETLDAELPVLSGEDVEFEALPNPYIGSRNRKLYNLWKNGDAAILPRQKEPVPYERWDNGERTDKGLFITPAEPYLPTTYSLYMGGDFGETVMKTGRPELPNALIVGDSFTNALETMLYTAFNETRSLDLRYYTEKTLKDYIADYQPDFVICIQNDTNYYVTTGNGAVWEDQ